MDDKILQSNKKTSLKNLKLSKICFFTGILPIVLNLTFIAIFALLVIFSIKFVGGDLLATIIFIILSVITVISPIISIITGIRAIKIDKINSGLANKGITFATINLTFVLAIVWFVLSFPRFG